MIQATAQTLINGGDTYTFVSDGKDGLLFTTGVNRTTIAGATKFGRTGTTVSLENTTLRMAR